MQNFFPHFWINSLRVNEKSHFPCKDSRWGMDPPQRLSVHRLFIRSSIDERGVMFPVCLCDTQLNSLELWTRLAWQRVCLSHDLHSQQPGITRGSEEKASRWSEYNATPLVLADLKPLKPLVFCWSPGANPGMTAAAAVYTTCSLENDANINRLNYKHVIAPCWAHRRNLYRKKKGSVVFVSDLTKTECLNKYFMEVFFPWVRSEHTCVDLVVYCDGWNLSHLLEVVLGELIGDAEQLSAGVCVCKGPDSQTVGGVQLSLEELAAGLLDLCELQQTCCGQQSLDVPLLHRHLGHSAQIHMSVTALLRSHTLPDPPVSSLQWCVKAWERVLSISRKLL